MYDDYDDEEESSAHCSLPNFDEPDEIMCDRCYHFFASKFVRQWIEKIDKNICLECLTELRF